MRATQCLQWRRLYGAFDTIDSFKYAFAELALLPFPITNPIGKALIFNKNEENI